MSRPRLVALIVLLVTPAFAFRLGGTALWSLMFASVAIGAAVALYVLWQDELLGDVIKPKNLDVSYGVVAAALMYTALVLAFNLVIAPASEMGGLLRNCTLSGPRVAREGLHGWHALLEAIRGETCRSYAVSLGLVGPLRGVAIVVTASLEEVAWRGGVQQGLSERFGSTRGWIATSILCGLAHIATGNVLLGLLAFGTSLVWGALFRYRRRLFPGVASHAVFSYFLFHARPLVSFA